MTNEPFVPPDEPEVIEPSKAPVAKVTAATTAGALATVVVIVVTSITHNDAPPGLEGAIATVFAFLGGYLAPRQGA